MVGGAVPSEFELSTRETVQEYNGRTGARRWAGQQNHKFCS
jgi:hypothetical protein